MQNQEIDFIGQKIGSTPNFISLKLRLAGVEYRPGTQMLGESYALNFLNKKNRGVQVIFYSSDDEKFFLINIVNSEIKDTFSLINWLKKNNLSAAPTHFKLSNYAGDFERKVEMFSGYIDSLFHNSDLYVIVNGDKWETVPFDWAGMK